MHTPMQYLTVVGISLALGLSGCTVKSTVEQITDTTSNITGTTSGAAWWSEDGQIKPAFKATAFVAFNYENLRHDLATGQGEYLSSISRLLGVPAQQEPAFFSDAQAEYAGMGDQGPAALLTLLRERAHPFVN